MRGAGTAVFRAQMCANGVIPKARMATTTMHSYAWIVLIVVAVIVAAR